MEQREEVFKMVQIDKDKGRWMFHLSASKYDFGFGFRFFWARKPSWWFNISVNFLFFAAEINYDQDMED